jgi:hypothetical protein
MNTPDHKVTTVSKHEWIIGKEDHPTTFKDLHDGIWFAQNEMTDNLGIDLSHDDAYHVRAGEGGQIILFVEIESKN